MSCWGFRFIKAAAFLEGFHEPALALLYEPTQTCAGRLASKRSTCRLVVFSINLTQVGVPFLSLVGMELCASYCIDSTPGTKSKGRLLHHRGGGGVNVLSAI